MPKKSFTAAYASLPTLVTASMSVYANCTTPSRIPSIKFLPSDIQSYSVNLSQSEPSSITALSTIFGKALRIPLANSPVNSQPVSRIFGKFSTIVAITCGISSPAPSAMRGKFSVMP